MLFHVCNDYERNIEGFFKLSHINLTFPVLLCSFWFCFKSTQQEKKENVFKLIESYFFPFHLFIFCFKGPIHYSWVQSRNLILIQPYYLFSYFMLYHLHRQWPQLIHFVYLKISSVCQVIGGHLSISWYSELLCVYYLCKPLVRGPVSSK